MLSWNGTQVGEHFVTGFPSIPDDTVELATLKLFLHVAAAGSFSRAAALAATTQPAVSKRILALERELGTALFERTGRGARLTEAGRALLPRAEALTNDADQLADAIAGDTSRPRGTVRVAIQPSVAWPMVRDLFTRSRAAFPSIHLQVTEAPTGQIVEWLRDGRHDLGVLSQPGHDALPNAETLFAPPIHLVSRAGDALTRRPTVAFDRLAGLPLVIAVMPNGGRVLLEEIARRRGVRLDVVMGLYSIHLIKKLVGAGLAYTIAHASAIADELRAGQLAASRIVSPRMTQAFFLSITAARRPTAAVRAVAQLVRELAASRPLA